MRRDDVATGIQGALAGAGVRQSAAQHRGVLVVDQAAVHHAVAAQVFQSIIGFFGIDGAHFECRLGNCAIGARNAVASAQHIVALVHAAQHLVAHRIGGGTCIGGRVRALSAHAHFVRDESAAQAQAHSRHAGGAVIDLAQATARRRRDG